MAEPAAQARILVVDDHATNRLKLATVVGNLGHATEDASDGEAALDRLQSGGIDLVLLDIVMPGIDGYEVLRRMRADPDLSEIPVLVISSLDDLRDVAQGIELGAQDFLTKSFDPVILRARISVCLEQKRLRDKELAYLRDVRTLTSAARTFEVGAGDRPDLGISGVGERPDGLGRLARVFGEMAEEVQRRDRAYRDRIGLLRGTFVLLAIGVLWGLSPTLARSLSGLARDSVGLAALVTLISTLLLLATSVLSGRLPKLSAGRLRFALLAGCVGTAMPQVVLLQAAIHLPATILSVIVALEAVFVFLIAAAFRIEAPDYRRFSGLLLGLICVLLLVLPGGEAGVANSAIWIVAALLIPLGYAGETIALSIWPVADDDVLSLATLTMAGATVILWPLALALDDVPSASILVGPAGVLILGLSVISCLSTGLLIVAIRQTGAVFAGQSAYAVACAGVVWGVLLLGEHVGIWTWIAFVALALGLALVAPSRGSTGTDRADLEPDPVR